MAASGFDGIADDLLVDVNQLQQRQSSFFVLNDCQIRFSYLNQMGNPETYRIISENGITHSEDKCIHFVITQRRLL